jgi:hypothetical protein
MRRGLTVDFVIISWSPEGIVQEQVAAPGSLVVFVVVKPMTTILSSGVVAFVGSVGSES